MEITRITRYPHTLLVLFLRLMLGPSIKFIFKLKMTRYSPLFVLVPIGVRIYCLLKLFCTGVKIF